jgi:hypothetical protein
MASSVVHAWEFVYDLSSPLAIWSQLQLVSSVVCHGAVYFREHIFMYDTYVKYRAARKCQQKFWRNIHDERVPSRQKVHNLVNKLRTAGLLINKKHKQRCWVLTEEKLDDIGTRLEHTPRRSLKHLAQETGVSKSSARTSPQLLKLTHYKTTVIYAFQPRDPCSRVHFCSFFLVCCWRWDWYAVDILFWWSVVSHAGIHKYAK